MIRNCKCKPNCADWYWLHVIRTRIGYFFKHVWWNDANIFQEFFLDFKFQSIIDWRINLNHNYNTTVVYSMYSQSHTSINYQEKDNWKCVGNIFTSMKIHPLFPTILQIKYKFFPQTGGACLELAFGMAKNHN